VVPEQPADLTREPSNVVLLHLTPSHSEPHGRGDHAVPINQCSKIESWCLQGQPSEPDPEQTSAFGNTVEPREWPGWGAKRTQHEQCQISNWALSGIDACVRFGRVFVHCKRGLGGAGLVAARLLFERGVSPDNAITRVRRMRPGAIETRAQEDYLRALGRTEAARVCNAKA